MINQCYDKTGREIREGDILKVFHFTGSRNKKHYMYKMAWVLTLDDGRNILMANHLGKHIMNGVNQSNSYRLPVGFLEDYEIVEGYSCQGDEISFEDRPKVKDESKSSSVG